MTTEQEIQNLEEQVANLEAMVKNLASGYASTQINRIQMSTDTAAKWEKTNRACKPGGTHRGDQGQWPRSYQDEPRNHGCPV